ncbi:CopG family transcriptional regulator [Chelatococcus sp.]|uniref:ribbon-helix-helix domain-containing protein n=1 Tax=Chelatococcus sp. TaxID=1953771 RepID=UPI00342193F0
MSINVVQKKRGRPKTGQDPVSAIRLSPELRAAIDKACSAEADNPSRSEMIRRIVSDWLQKNGYFS